MTIYQKFGLSFVLALSLHLIIIAAFGVNVESETKLIKPQALPEIIKASILDDNKIQQEANRLKSVTETKRLAQNALQQNIESNRKKEQKLLLEAKNKRLKEEKNAKALALKRNKQLLKDQQILKQLKQQKLLESARLAKIKQQKIVEENRLENIKQQKKLEAKRLDDLRKAEIVKQELAKQQALKKQQEIIAQNQRDEAAQLAKRIEQQNAQQAQDKQATISATSAIRKKVNNSWIRPLSAIKGLNCTIRVKLLPSGDVMDVTVIKGSGDRIFDRSAENAVHKASPLPVPKSRALFSQFRTFTFNFKPE